MSITLRAKRILTGALAGALVLGLLPAGVASANTDVCDGASSAGFADTDTTHQANIDCAVAYGIVSGQAGNVFNASGNMTRGQMATALVNFVATAKNVDVSALPTGTNTFEDVAGTTHEANIARAFAMGIIQGRSATVFDPGSRITRGAAATMIANAHVSADALGMDLSGVTPATNFTDLGDSVHAGNINVLAAAGVITGTSATTFSPNRAVTRGQTVTLLMGAANLVVAPNGLWNAPALSTPVIAGNVVTERAGDLTVVDAEFKYSTGSEIVTVKLGTNDVYIIDGFTGTVETFNTDLSVGDAVVVEKDTPAAGRQTIRLTNRDNDTFYNSGTIAVTATATTDFDIIEPVSGVALREFRAGNDTGIEEPLTTYSVDGSTVTLAQFRQNWNTGDSIVVSGAGTTANPFNFALTNRTVTGTVEARDATGDPNTITVKSSIGFSTEEFTITNTANTVLTLDGTTVSPSSGNQAAFTETAVRVGDSVVVGKAGGVLTVSVTRVASAAVSGIVGGSLGENEVPLDENNSGTTGNVAAAAGQPLVFTRAAATFAQETAENIDQYNLVVDGSTVSPAVFISQLTVGDAVTVLEKDDQLRPKGTITLTNQALSGAVDKASIDTTDNDEKLRVKLNTASTAVLTANINFAEKLFGGSADATYSVNGTTGTLAAFKTALDLVAEGTRTATIVISRVGDATNYALTTSAAAAATFTVTDPGAVPAPGATEIEITFTQPLRYETAAFAASDFVVKIAGVTVEVSDSDMAVSPAAHGAGGVDNEVKVTLTIAETVTVATNVVSVELTATGAAKMRDKNGTAPAAATKTVTVD